MPMMGGVERAAVNADFHTGARPKLALALLSARKLETCATNLFSSRNIDT